MGNERFELRDSVEVKLIGPDGKVKKTSVKKESKIDRMLHFLLKMLEEPDG